MITAQEAKAIKLDVVSDEQEINDTIESIGKGIKRMAEMGFDSYVYEFNRREYYKIIHDKLIELGYRVSIMDRTLIQIFW